MTIIINGTSGVTFPAGGLGNPAGAVVGTTDTQTLTNKTIQGGAITSGTAITLTNQTVVDFTSLPSWVKRITVVFGGISTNGTSTIQCQLGTSSGFATSGYFTTLASISSSTISIAFTTGFGVVNTPAAVNSYYGQMIITLLDSTSNFWGCTSTVTAAGTVLQVSGGGINLSGALTSLRLTTVGGTNTFDAGSVNILYE